MHSIIKSIQWTQNTKIRITENEESNLIDWMRDWPTKYQLFLLLVSCFSQNFKWNQTVYVQNVKIRMSGKK